MKQNETLHSQQGSAMVISLMTLVLMTMVGAALLMQTNTETQIAAHDMRSTQALFNAEAGYGEVLARLNDPSDTTNFIGEDPSTVNPGWGRYLVLEAGNSADDPDYPRAQGDGLDNNGNNVIDEDGEAYPEILSKQTSTDAINYPWVKVHYKLDNSNQVILFGDHDNNLTTDPTFNLVRGGPVLMVTAAGGQGEAVRKIEVEAFREPIRLPQNAIYTEGSDWTFGGTSFLISGKDWDPVTGMEIIGNPEVPAINALNQPDSLSASLDGAQTNNVDGLGVEPSIVQSNIDMYVMGLRDEYAPQAAHNLAAGSYTSTTWGDYDDYTVVYCNGDLTLNGETVGYGILIVEGDLKIVGSHTWTGVTVVLGSVNLIPGGLPVRIYGTSLILSGGGGNTVSGNSRFLFSSTALARLRSLTPYLVSNWKEL
jgi:hypothetical protein